MERTYRLVRRVGSGHHAEVFEGLITGPDGFEKRVAFKRLAADLSERTTRALADEARIASQLSHPNVVAVFDFGMLEGAPVIVMEFVDGLDLGSLIEAARHNDDLVPSNVSLLIARDVALALHAVHEQTSAAGQRLGIVHRDVSPSNIMLTWQGDVKLADFGVAKAINKQLVTEAGTVHGKLPYLAPEQLRGQPATNASDIFALGCVLTQLLAGRSPMKDKAVRDRVVLGEHPLDVLGWVDQGYFDLLRSALEPNARRRFEDGEAMARAIDAILSKTTPRVHSLTVRDWLKALDVRRRGRAVASKKGILDLPSAGSLSLSTDPNARFVESTMSSSSDAPWSDKTELVAGDRDPDTVIDEC